MRNDGMENLFEPIIGNLVGKYSFELFRMVTPLEEVCDMNGNFILELLHRFLNIMEISISGIRFIPEFSWLLI